ncbi:SDR family NAD(P)-dependent oxidoreductase [Leifsonia sp. fls2-241-R2A-40a]|uniref:SDR family NAD(P)-dependent oxidoreductase n=1 Tax=Leifsonia sp. fls2-241-R2A-40a TaxID=3040290 RepID=UPI00254D12EE|nr:SDR family NAD(P)-dependent oxidoreductase [Leifsonia sp. fls2-241-R2A-40a]
MSARTALVTGGSQGIGAAVVQRLADDGYRVCFIDLAEARGTQLAEVRSTEGHDVRFHRGDVRVDADLRAAVDGMLEDWGRLDVLVNNAGRNSYHDAVAMTEDEWDEVFAVDLKSAWLSARACLPALQRTRGAIVNVSSIHARLTTPGMFPYAAAKAAVEGLTRSLAVDYARSGVRVNAVAPGWTRTQLVDEWLDRQADPDQARQDILDAHPLGYIAEPADVAAVIAFLASPLARAVTGAVFPVDCGLGATFAIG